LCFRIRSSRRMFCRENQDRIALAQGVLTKINYFWKNRKISLQTKIRILVETVNRLFWAPVRLIVSQPESYNCAVRKTEEDLLDFFRKILNRFFWAPDRLTVFWSANCTENLVLFRFKLFEKRISFRFISLNFRFLDFEVI
jgi:hypothetical protein